MKKFATGVLAVLLIVAAADVSIGTVLDTALSLLPDAGSLEADEHQALFDRSPQVLLLGSSRTRHEYDPQMIGRVLGKTCYNAGIDGHGVNYSAIVLESAVARRPPQVVTLDLLAAMVDGTWSRTGLTSVIPYYGKNRALTAYIDDWAAPEEPWLLRSNLYRLNGVTTWLMKAYIKGRRAEPTDGYDPYDTICDDAEYILSDEFKPAEGDVACLDRIVELCDGCGARLVVFVSPNYDVNTAFNSWIADYCRRHGVEFHDFSFDKRFEGHPELFAEPRHLNIDGARLYTGLVIDCITGDNAAATCTVP